MTSVVACQSEQAQHWQAGFPSQATGDRFRRPFATALAMDSGNSELRWILLNEQATGNQHATVAAQFGHVGTAARPGRDRNSVRTWHHRRAAPLQAEAARTSGGRPRETIRRRLERLRKAGRVHRLPDGWVYDVASIDEDMQALAMDGVRRFLETADVMRAVLREAGAAVRDRDPAPAGRPARRAGS
jgi:hypothetical protein